MFRELDRLDDPAYTKTLRGKIVLGLVAAILAASIYAAMVVLLQLDTILE